MAFSNFSSHLCFKEYSCNQFNNHHHDADAPQPPDTLQTDSHNSVPLKIYVKPSVSFDIDTKQGADSDETRKDGDDDHHHPKDNDDDNNGDDGPAVRPLSVRLHGTAPSTENLENRRPPQPPKTTIQFTRPKKSVPPIDRPHKYSLRQNPTPSRKYQ